MTIRHENGRTNSHTNIYYVELCDRLIELFRTKTSVLSQINKEEREDNTVFCEMNEKNLMDTDGGILITTAILIGAGCLVGGTALGLGTVYVVSKLAK